jgi:hypothetical protein
MRRILIWSSSGERSYIFNSRRRKIGGMGKLRQYLALFRELQNRPVTKALLFFWPVAAIYDLLLSQFIPEHFARKFPKAWEVALMTGNLLSWWGWLLVLAGILVIASFEYAIRSHNGTWQLTDRVHGNLERKAADDLEKHVDESMPFLFEKLGDLSALTSYGCLTVAQCALMLGIRTFKRPGDVSEPATHYVQLALLDIAHGKLCPKHPKSLLPYSQYLRMAEAGMFGIDGENMPVVNMGWLVPLDEAERWYQSTGGDSVIFDGLKAELAQIAAHNLG